MKKYVALYNPYALSNSGADCAKKLLEFYDEQQIEFVDITAVKYDDLFSALSDSTLIICGGDGTLNRFINDTKNLTLPDNILYYACGSGNDFLTDIGGKAGERPLKLNKYISDLPTVAVNGKSYLFLNNVGFGIDGYCCEVGDQLRKQSDKPVNYAGIAIKGLLGKFHTRNATVMVDGVLHTYKHVWLAPTMKGRFYGGGMMIVPTQDRTEKTVSVAVLHCPLKLKTLIVFPNIFKGTHIKHGEMYECFSGNDITVKFDRPTALQIDGETVLGVTEYSVCTHLCPKSAENKTTVSA
ncbi:MAG: diacylglycerol kinase family protein [Oscillospiraceae bacterium]|nr:diacylglycerol kinase family protein [Candidatus Equicaccousia limihippi]